MKRKKLQVVVDTNLFISGFIVPQGNPHALLKALRKNQFQLLISHDLFNELKTVIKRPKYRIKYGITTTDITHFLHNIDAVAKKVIPIAESPIPIRDPKDKMVLTAALGGKADYIVTGDEDLLTLHGNPKLDKLKIIKVKDFLKFMGT